MLGPWEHGRARLSKAFKELPALNMEITRRASLLSGEGPEGVLPGSN